MTRVVPSGGAFALLFPKNISGGDTTAPGVYIKFANPNTNGLPLWGVSGGGVTVVRKISMTSPQQQGFYAMFWWARGDGTFTDEGYWGMHPYPDDGTATGPGSSTHGWEVATNSGDWLDAFGGGTPPGALPITAGVTLTQIMIVTRADANSKTFTFYPDASNTASPNFVQKTITTANYGEGAFTAPFVVIGDSPWSAPLGTQAHERFGGTLDAIKIITPALSLADAKLEGADFSQMVTSGGQSGKWWGKNGFNSVDDLTDSYGTGRSFIWHDTANKGTMVSRL